MALAQKWPLRKQPLNLNEVLQLRNGIALSKKVLDALLRKSSKKTKSGGLPIFSLN